MEHVDPEPSPAEQLRERAESRMACVSGRRCVPSADDSATHRPLHELQVPGCRAPLAKRRPCDLIFMDLQMPEMGGTDATREIRALAGGADTPIVAMTANAFNEDRQACCDPGLNEHVAKPGDPDTPYAVALQWLDALRRTKPRA